MTDKEITNMFNSRERGEISSVEIWEALIEHFRFQKSLELIPTNILIDIIENDNLIPYNGMEFGDAKCFTSRIRCKDILRWSKDVELLKFIIKEQKEDNYTTLLNLSENPFLKDEELMWEITRSDSYIPRECLANHENVNTDILKHLYHKDKSSKVRNAAAHNLIKRLER
jgi:hypothetical protein